MAGIFNASIFNNAIFNTGATVSVPDASGPGAGFPTVYYQTGKRRKPRRNRLDLLLDKVIEEYYEEILEQAPVKAVQKAEKLVAPFETPLQEIDWRAFEADLAKVRALLKIWEETVANEDDEEVLLMSQ